MARDPLAWRGSLAPADRAAWFRSYEAFLAPCLTLAARHHVATFVLGAESTSLEDDPGWRSVVVAARRALSGELSYDANWDDYVSRHVSVPVDHLGIDAYFPLPRLGDDASVSQIAEGWQRWLDRKSTGAAPDRPERGRHHRRGRCLSSSGGVDGRGKLSPTVQRRWFEAACRVARDRKMAGLYWWNLDFHADPSAGTPAGSRTSFLGRPAEAVIASCFRTWPRRTRNATGVCRPALREGSRSRFRSRGRPQVADSRCCFSSPRPRRRPWSSRSRWR